MVYMYTLYIKRYHSKVVFWYNVNLGYEMVTSQL